MSHRTAHRHRGIDRVGLAATVLLWVLPMLLPSAAAAVFSSTHTAPVAADPAMPVATVREVRVSGAVGADAAGPGAAEPVVATHPTDPSRIAVVYQRFSGGGTCPADPALVISRDGGLTWKPATRPWAGSGRCPGFHAAIAWGPGPKPGSARLYWTDTIGDAGGLRLAIAWTDDEGGHWSRLHVEERTPPWVGGFPDITVDRSGGSPNRGAVYVVYNWPADAQRGPGIRLLASGNFGATWWPLDVPRASGAAGFPASWRVDSRVRTGPDGSVYVAFFEEDLRTWNAANVFSRGAWGNVGRVGYAVARVTFDRSSGRLAASPTVLATTLPVNAWTAYSASTAGTADNLADPTWSLSLDVDEATGRVLLGVGDYGPPPQASTPRGSVRIGRSDDGGRTWRWSAVPSVPAIGGRLLSSFRPALVSTSAGVFLGLRDITDVPDGAGTSAGSPTLGEAWTWSTDGGVTFAVPRALTAVRWSAVSLATNTNGPGLRDRADRTASGNIVYAWGDGRLARPAPDPMAGRVAVYGVVVTPESAAAAVPASARSAGRERR